MYKNVKNEMPKKMMLNSKMEKGLADAMKPGMKAKCRIDEYLRPFKEKKILY